MLYQNSFKESLKYIDTITYKEYKLILTTYFRAHINLIIKNLMQNVCNVINILGIYEIHPKDSRFTQIYTDKNITKLPLSITSHIDKLVYLKRVSPELALVNGEQVYTQPFESNLKIKLLQHLKNLYKTSIKSTAFYVNHNLYNADYEFIKKISIFEICIQNNFNKTRVLNDLKFNINIAEGKSTSKFKLLGSMLLMPEKYEAVQLYKAGGKNKKRNEIIYKNIIYKNKAELTQLNYYTNGLF